jgi:hypothetical protein
MRFEIYTRYVHCKLVHCRSGTQCDHSSLPCVVGRIRSHSELRLAQPLPESLNRLNYSGYNASTLWNNVRKWIPSPEPFGLYLTVYASHTMNNKYHSTIPGAGMNVLSGIGNISWRLQTPHCDTITVSTHQVTQDTQTHRHGTALLLKPLPSTTVTRYGLSAHPSHTHSTQQPHFECSTKTPELRTRICGRPKRSLRSCRLGYRRVLINPQII